VEVDGLRFFAIMSVVFYHLNGYIQDYSTVKFATPPSNTFLSLVLAQGHYGVQLFFVISGFILALPFAEHYLKRPTVPALGRYFKRRISRLEPPYIANLVLVFALLVLVKKGTFSILIPHLLASIVYLHNLIYRQASAINSVAWSLEVEVQFYILAPLINSVFLIHRGWIRRLMLCIAAITCGWLFRTQHGPVSCQARSSISLSAHYWLTCF